MPARQKGSWTSNEYFAHKKNVGEEVKLRYEMYIIERGYALVKDSWKHKFGEARRSLQNLRKSTGHSIDGLPPTPFQTNSRRASLTSMPRVTVPTSLQELPPEYRYLDNEVTSLSAVPAVNVSRADAVERVFLENFATNENYDNCGKLNVSHPPQLSSDQNNYSYATLNGDLSSAYKEMTMLPNLDKGNGSLIAPIKNPSFEKEKTNPSINDDCSTVLQLPSIQNSSQSTGVTKGYRDNSDLTLLYLKDKPEGSNHLFPGNIYIAEPDDQLRTSSKADQQDRSSVFSGNGIEDDRKSNSERFSTERRIDIPSMPTRSNTHASSNLLSRRKETQSKKKEKKDKNAFMRDIRTRCRTCQERFRQNAEYERMKKEKEKLEQIQSQQEKPFSQRKMFAKNQIFTIDVDDLESTISDEVLDFDKDTPTTMKKTGRCKKGYSRKRLDELCQPKAGRRRKALFSKRVIKREVDSLIESHSTPEMTEREKERVRMLESRIRMFLAMMQNSLMPTKMVDIPQREDIMKVDISHH